MGWLGVPKTVAFVKCFGLSHSRVLGSWSPTAKQQCAQPMDLVYNLLKRSLHKWCVNIGHLQASELRQMNGIDLFQESEQLSEKKIPLNQIEIESTRNYFHPNHLWSIPWSFLPGRGFFAVAVTKSCQLGVRHCSMKSFSDSTKSPSPKSQW